MTPYQATDLAGRIAQSWPRSSITAVAWEEELAELDAGRAGTTLVRLRRDRVHAPSIADFLAMYRTVDTSGPRPDPCETCAESGWRHIDPPRYTTHGHGQHTRRCAARGGGDCNCEGVAVPCTCPAGRRAEQLLDQWGTSDIDDTERRIA